MKKKKIIWILAVFFIAILGLGLYLLWIGNQKTYTAEDFGIETIHSQNDADQDGMDDYTDILYGAKAEAKENQLIKVLIILVDILQKQREFVQM